MRITNPKMQALCVCALLSAVSAASAQQQPADWPCVQRLVPKLEAGQMWSGPPLEEVTQPSPELQQAARGLIDLKASPETLGTEVRAFGAQQPEAERARALGQLFWLSLDWLNDERDVVVRGIKRFAVGQQALADKIVAETRELEKLQQASATDAGRARAAAGGAPLGHPDLHRPPEIADAGLRPARPARAARLRARPHHPGKPAMNRRGLLALGLALLAAPAWAAETVADRVFGAGLLAGVTEPTVLHYRFEMSGKDIVPPFASHIDVDVREVAPDGAKSVFVDMFEGANRRQFGPIAAQDQNPLVLVFLQRDVTQMANLTGGAAGYFQQQVRRGFNDPAVVEPFEVTLGDRKLAGTRLVMTPFANDPNIDRFPQFKGKSYEFIVADGVPGGIYRLGSLVPGPADGQAILQETVTFEEVRP